MIKEDIPLYKLDLSASSQFNAVIQESKSRTNVVNNNIFIPPKGPFYQKTFKMYDKAGKLLVENVDYEFYGMMGKLTQYTAKPVGLFVRILKDEILEWKMDYQVVGNFSVITNSILNMLQSIYEDDRFVLWDNIDNKPLWFIPTIHQHDLAYDIFGFSDLVTQLNRIATYVQATSSASEFMLQVFQDKLAVYIDGYKSVLTKILDSHIDNLHDAHGVDKESIGLGNVANVKTATLAETLDGTRDDLRITVYNAAKAAEASSGRNDKLFPSGSLPILRYGSDTFIPPTIGGSFEGLGGISRRCGMIVETDGTLLVMTHRNNGKYRGLYFTRCKNYLDAEPEYDFTAYMYQHPTATAAGATLDTIINGSNRYVMVVGDKTKNLWWWCETKGTFNPDRHVLIPLTGEWVTEDMSVNIPVSSVATLTSLAMVVADSNYADHWAIYQAYPVDIFLERRPAQCPDYATQGPVAYGSGTVRNAGFSINIVGSKSGTIKRSKVNFTHPIFGNFADSYFAPWFPKTETINGKIKVTSGSGKYDPPINSFQAFRSPSVFWLNNGNFGEFAFRLDYNTRIESDTSTWGAMSAWRGTAKIMRNGNDFVTEIIAAPGSDQLYTIDINNLTTGNKQWDDFYKNVVSRYEWATLDQTGCVAITGGYIGYAQGAANVSFPPVYSMAKPDYLESPERLLLPPAGTSDVSLVYDQKTFTETNPLGMATMFSQQRFLSADSNDYTKSGIMAVQVIDGKAQWFFRYMPFMNSNYDHVAPSQNTTFQGITYLHYPFTPSGVVCDAGMQLFPGSQMPIAGINNKDNQKKFLGATCDTTVDGSKPNGSPNGAGRYLGDGLLVYESAMSVNDGTMSITPVIVVDLKPVLARTIVPLFKAAGFAENNIYDSWAVHLVLSPTGAWHAVWLAFNPVAPNIVIGAVVTTLTPGGTSSQVNGYTKYTDANVTVLSPIKTYTRSTIVSNNGIAHPVYSSGGSSLPFCMATPYKGIVNNVKDVTGYHVAISTSARWVSFGGALPGAAQLEIKADGTVINKIGDVWIQDWGAEQSTTCNPYYGIGDSDSGLNVFEGAAIGSNIYNQTTSIYDNITARNYSPTNFIGMSNILTPQYTVYFQQQTGVILSGKMYDIDATYIDILTIDPAPANKIFYIYLRYSDTKGVYLITPEVLPESSSQALIAKVTCGPTQIDLITPYNRFTMDGAQISANREGSAILASSGSVFEIGDTSSILLNSDFIS